jgi:hypothetical protein
LTASCGFDSKPIHHIQLAGSDYASSTTNSPLGLPANSTAAFKVIQWLNFRFAAPTAVPKNPTHLDNVFVLLGIDYFSPHQLDAQPFFGNEVDPKPLSANTTESS